MQNTWIKLFVELELTVKKREKRRKVVLCVFLPRRNSFLILLPPHISRNTSKTLFSYWFITNNLNNSRSKTSSWSILERRRKKLLYTIFQVKSFSPPWFFIEFSSFSLKTRIHTSYKTTKKQQLKKSILTPWLVE